MAGKNINIVSKTLAESYIRKQIKALKQDPAQTNPYFNKTAFRKTRQSFGKVSSTYHA